MPATINGIGTHYYGRRNPFDHQGVCEHCNRQTMLRSYDTRLWVCVVFIPIVPLGRKRIVDECSSCSVHRAVPLHEWERLRQEALEKGMKDVVAHPQDAQKLMDLHKLCIELQETDKAKALEQRLETEFPRNEQVLLHLAMAHAYLGHPRKAAQALERARGINPDLKTDFDPGNTPLQSTARPVNTKAVLIVIGALLLIGLTVFLGANAYVKNHRTLHVVTAIPVAHSLEIPGIDPVSLDGPGHTTVQLPEGDHIARVRGTVDTEHAFTVEGSFPDRLLGTQVFILNVADSAMILREEVIYSVTPVNEENPYSVLFGKPFRALTFIDAPFTTLPDEIEMTGNRATRTRLQVIHASVSDVAEKLRADRKPFQAMDLLEWALKARPWERNAVLATYGRQAASTDPARATAFLATQLAQRPVDIEWHRTYQSLRPIKGSAEVLVEEYDRFVQAEPENPDLLYLRGRLEATLSGAAAFYTRALAVEGDHSYASHALAYGFASRGEWAKAHEYAVRAGPAFSETLDNCLMALREYDALEEKLVDQIKREPALFFPRLRLGLLLVARGKGDEALEACAAYEKFVADTDPNSLDWVRANVRGRVLYALEDHAELNALLAGSEEDGAQQLRLAAWLEESQFEKVEGALKREPVRRTPSLLLAMALAAACADDRPGFDRYVKHAAAKYSSAGPEGAATAAVLADPSPDAWKRGLEIAVDWKEKSLMLAVLAVRADDPPAALIETVRALNIDYSFPHHLIRRSLEGK